MTFSIFKAEKIYLLHGRDFHQENHVRAMITPLNPTFI